MRHSYSTYNPAEDHQPDDPGTDAPEVPHFFKPSAPGDVTEDFWEFDRPGFRARHLFLYLPTAALVLLLLWISWQAVTALIHG